MGARHMLPPQKKERSPPSLGGHFAEPWCGCFVPFTTFAATTLCRNLVGTAYVGGSSPCVRSMTVPRCLCRCVCPSCGPCACFGVCAMAYTHAPSSMPLSFLFVSGNVQKATSPGLVSFATFLVVQFWLSLGVAGWYGGEYAWGWWKVRSAAKKRQQAERAALAASEMPPPASPGSDGGEGEAGAGEGGEEGDGDAVRRRGGKSKARVSASEVDEEDE